MIMLFIYIFDLKSLKCFLWVYSLAYAVFVCKTNHPYHLSHSHVVNSALLFVWNVPVEVSAGLPELLLSYHHLWSEGLVSVQLLYCGQVGFLVGYYLTYCCERSSGCGQND